MAVGGRTGLQPSESHTWDGMGGICCNLSTRKESCDFLCSNGDRQSKATFTSSFQAGKMLNELKLSELVFGMRSYESPGFSCVVVIPSKLGMKRKESDPQLREAQEG